MTTLTLLVQVVLAGGLILVSWWLWHDEDGAAQEAPAMPQALVPFSVRRPPDQAA